MLTRSIFALFFAASCTEAFASDLTFNPEFCDFSVEFPKQYNFKELTRNGELGSAATVRASNSTNLAAECWPYTKQLSMEDYAKGIEAEAKQRGVIVGNIIIDRQNSIAPQVMLSGRITASGQSFHIKIISFMGTVSRLDLTMLDREITSKAQVDFRNSVKRK